ncbi:homing endonuclease associated repeat-containing protein [Rhizorhabdus dicambivorans]|uniref:Uncharacterized protein n=1 Tax=Rhizorhabdus dicambivorans TaxID=1850238 RepID=A0A2A4FTX0_9SPHN|nr:hypothetical protein [Rhizorhabdus dicambivorans]ATE65510.1 hypothetical protein CMV14_14770 [Rhizorhabdus dicambivorans]PCE41853.1 hypothetical protein COO09_12525 [Rhizorhabdus dicambivorans]
MRKAKAFTPLIDRATFNKAQSVRHNRRVNRLSDAELLDQLRRILSEHGRLCSRLIMATTGPDTQTYQKRFGSLDAAYHKVGYFQRHLGPAPESPSLFEEARAFARKVANGLRRQGLSVSTDTVPGLFRVNHSIAFATTLVRHQSEKRGQFWAVRINRSYSLDYVFAGLMRADGKAVQTHLLLPVNRFPPSAEMVIKDGPNKIGQLW